jgi:hypothetical protein
VGKGPKVNQSVIDNQAQLQQQLGGLATTFANTGLPYLKQAGSYWQDIMKGGQAAQLATAPYAQKISQASQGAQNTIQNFMPSGGEKNLALEQLPMQRAGQIASLYQGMGPQAASALGSLGLGSAQAGTGFGGVSANAGGTLANLAGQQSMAKGSALGGLGQGLGTLAGSFVGK